MATVATSPNDLTRQQLDELDSLLQRMLSLPLNPPESYSPAAPVQAYAPPTPYPTPAPPAREVPMPVVAPRAFTPPSPEPAEPTVPWKSTPAPTPIYVPTLVPVPAPVLPAPVIELPAPLPSPKPAKVAPVPVVAKTPVPIAPRSEPIPFLFAPLVGVNALLNGTLGLFGMPGRFLRSGFVKSLLGLTGLGLLAYTGLKVAQIHGWISLQEQLPWPR